MSPITLFDGEENRSVAFAERSGAEPVMSEPSMSVVSSLMEVIAARKARPPAERSYVAALLQGGVPAIGAKIVEEAGEVVAAADEPGESGRGHLVHEVADLVFHTLVLLGHHDIPWQDVEAELARRFGIGGFVEKASRTRTPTPDPSGASGRRVSTDE